MTAHEEGDQRPQRIAAIYGPASDGKIRVYAGELELTTRNSTWRARGDLVLHPGERPGFTAEFAGDDPQLMELFGAKDPSVSVPDGERLERSPVESALVEPDQKPAKWIEYTLPLNQLEAGDITRSERIILHVNGELSEYPLPEVETTDGERQEQLSVRLGKWGLRIAGLDGDGEDQDVSFVVEATPESMPVDREDVERLIRRVLMLLRFTAGGGITVGARVGLDSNNEVVWAAWGSGRMESAGWRWCPDQLVNAAIPKLAQGLADLEPEAGLEACVDRAIGLLLATNEGVLDTKIPISCSGLELLAWAILQHKQWMTPDALDRISAGARVRLLLQWAGVGIELPSDYAALSARRGRLGQASWSGPELVFNIRNSLVHPPKRLTDPEWPKSAELVEAWQLSTWYLEVILLRIFGYEGEYTSRLDLSGYKGRTEPLPWAETADTDADNA